MPGELQEAWAEYRDAAERSRELLESTARFTGDPDLQGPAYAGLLEAQAMAYNFLIAPTRSDTPEVFWQSTWHADLYCLGQPISDFQYGGLFLDGRGRYRVHGGIGDLRLLPLQVHTRVQGAPGSAEIGNYVLDDHTDDQGRFSLTVGAHDDADIRLDPRSADNFLLVRRIVGDWFDDVGTLDVEVLDAPPARSIDAATTAAAIRAAAGFLEYLVRVFTVGLHDLYIARADGRTNAWAVMPGQEVATSLVGSPSTTYVPAVFQIAEDEAVLVEWDPPKSAYWSFQVGDVWSRSLDFTHRQTDLNMVRAAVDPDGRVRVVLCLTDPGYANWLDPCGHRTGTLVVRNYRAPDDTVAPTMRVVRLADLPAQLPAGAARRTDEERRRDLAHRRAGIRAFFGGDHVRS
jgi:hypothetical protein